MLTDARADPCFRLRLSRPPARRSEATKAFELEKKTRALGETIRRVEEGLRSRGRSLAEARRRAAAAEDEAALLRGRLRAAQEEAADQASNSNLSAHLT